MDLERCHRILAGVARDAAVTPPAMLSDDEAGAILDLARVVAHGVERKAAPLVCYSVGRALASMGEPDRLAFVRNAVAAISAPSGEPTSEG